MCGGFIGSLFGLGGTPETKTVTPDPTPTAMSDVGGDTSKAGSGSTKKAKGKGFDNTVKRNAALKTPLGGSSNLGDNSGQM